MDIYIHLTRDGWTYRARIPFLRSVTFRAIDSILTTNTDFICPPQGDWQITLVILKKKNILLVWMESANLEMFSLISTMISHCAPSIHGIINVGELRRFSEISHYFFADKLYVRHTSDSPFWTSVVRNGDNWHLNIGDLHLGVAVTSSFRTKKVHTELRTVRVVALTSSH